MRSNGKDSGDGRPDSGWSLLRNEVTRGTNDGALGNYKTAFDEKDFDERVHALQENERFWYAIYVKSRHEFIVREDLAHEEIPAFLPTIQRKRQWKDRKKLVDFPIFPGYLFVQLEPRLETFTHVVKTRGVVRLLAAERGFPTIVPDHEIDSLRILLAKGDDFDIFPHLQEGAMVRVKRGPLKGAEGTLALKGEKQRFIVNIGILGRSVGVGIHADDLETA